MAACAAGANSALSRGPRAGGGPVRFETLESSFKGRAAATNSFKNRSTGSSTANGRSLPPVSVLAGSAPLITDVKHDLSPNAPRRRASDRPASPPLLELSYSYEGRGSPQRTRDRTRDRTLKRTPLEINQSAKILRAASSGDLAKRHLTRQNTGMIGSKTYEQLTAVSRKASRSNSRGRDVRELISCKSLLIDPRTSVFMPRWDVVISLAIVFTAFVTPYEVAFTPMSTTPDPSFIVNRVLDVIFVVDMGLNFLLIYSEGTEAEDGIVWVDSPSRIVRHYLTTWFALDFVSVGVSAIDIYALAASMGAAGGAGGAGGGGAADNDGGGKAPAGLTGVRALRALRALRLIKLVRLLRGSTIWRRWENKMAINYTALELCKVLVMMLVSAHWFACVWTLQANLQASVLDSWLGNYGYCEARTSIPSPIQGDPPTYPPCPEGWECPTDAPNVACLPGPRLYVVSIYWALATIVSVGYGDIGATPFNTAEQAVCALMMTLGGVLWGYVVGVFCGVIAQLSPATREFRQNMDDLNTYLAQNRVDPELRTRLREYFHQTRHLHDTSNQQRLLHMMSPMLLAEVVLAINQRWLGSVWFLKDAEAEFIVRLTLSLSPMVLAPYELAPCGFLYILARGVVIIGGDLLTKGATWGEDLILGAVAPSLIRPMNGKAITYAEVFLCSWDALCGALEGFPNTAFRIRKHALRLAMRRQISRVAAGVRRRAKREADRASTDKALAAAADHAVDSTAPAPAAASPDSTEPGKFVLRQSKTAGKLASKVDQTALSRSSTSGKVGNDNVKRMLQESTRASASEVRLQTQLINLRRGDSANAGSSCLLNGSNTTVSPLFGAPREVSAEASGSGRAARASGEGRSARASGEGAPSVASTPQNSFVDNTHAPLEGAADAAIATLAAAVQRQAKTLEHLSADMSALQSMVREIHASSQDVAMRSA